MTIPGWLTRGLRVVVAAIVVAIAGWYSPRITAALWHLFHPGGKVIYRGLHVEVPWPWTSDVDSVKENYTVSPEGISLRKTPRTLDRRMPTQSLFITVIAPDPGLSAAQQTEAWLKMFRDSHPESSFGSAVPGQIPEGASCLSARRPDEPRSVVWTCISVQGGWVADFEGQRLDEPVFFRVIAKLRR